MTNDEDTYQIADQTKVELSRGSITEYELEQLKDAGVVASYSTNNYELTQVIFNTDQLAKVAFEHSILDEVANTVEVEVMRYFRNTTNDRVTTKEITEALNRPPSTISRTLGQLVEKGQIKKVQQGIYEFP